MKKNSSSYIIAFRYILQFFFSTKWNYSKK